MQFKEQDWNEIRKLKLGGVIWELAPIEEITEPPKVTPKPIEIIPEVPKLPEPPVVPIVIEYEKIKPIEPEAPIAPKVLKTKKDETTTVRKKRQTKKRVQGNAKK
jgi:hypothetical protein